MGLLDKGSLLKHRNLGYVVRINDVQKGNYVLGWTTQPESRLTEVLLKGPWSASDLVREFVPQLTESKWDRLLDDDRFFEDAQPQE